MIKMMKILVCAAFVVDFYCAENAHFQKKTRKFQVEMLESLLCIVCLAQKKSLSKAHNKTRKGKKPQKRPFSLVFLTF